MSDALKIISISTLLLVGFLILPNTRPSSGQNLAQFDLDSTGEINAGDLVQFISAFASGTNSVDFNQDQLTNGLDAFELARNWKVKTGNRLGAPDLNEASTTDLLSSVEFFFTGDNPIQQGVDPGIFEATRVVVLRGMVLGQDGNPLPGVTVRIMEYPEFGFTLSRDDGEFDMVVNGGGMFRISFGRVGFLPLQRRVRAPWQDYLNVEDICLTELDPIMTSIDLSSGDYQMAEGSEMTDADGTRRACILFPPGTIAEAVMADGSSTSLSNLGVRATEFTVGEMGPMAMPATLPPQSGYTYCVEYSVDEAISMGASSVEFNQDLYHYNENFLDFPTGSIVPSGYYDREKGMWISSPNGLVIEILSIDGDLAVLDVDGSGTPAAAQALTDLNLTDDERRLLASMYAPDDTLWRVPISHFTPWDCNWPYGPPPDANPPPPLEPFDDPVEDECQESGSFIDVHNQIFGEEIEIAGTPFTLNYRSNRVAGNKTNTALDVPITGATVPVSLDGARIEIMAGGVKLTQNFDNSPNQSFEFNWPGVDAYGRQVVGSHPFTAQLCFRYPAVYLQPSQFAESFNRVPNDAIVIGERGKRNIISLCRRINGSFGDGVVGKLQAVTQGFGGWTLDVHHSYDPVSRTLHEGNGTERKATSANLPNIVQTVLHLPASQIREVVVAPDGGVYFTNDLAAEIDKLEPDGTVTVVAGNENFQDDGTDGVPATETSVRPSDIYLGPDGCLYVSETGSIDFETNEIGHNRIRKIDREGIITTVAGNSDFGFSGDGGSALEASFREPTGVAVGSDGSIYIADTGNHRIRKVFPDGTIDTIAGTGNMGFETEDVPATESDLWHPGGLDVAEDGTVYFSNSGTGRILKISPEGILSRAAGGGAFVPGLGDFGPARDAAINNPHNVRIGPDGETLYIPDLRNKRLRQVLQDGTIITLAGGGDPEDNLGDGLSGPLAEFDSPYGVDWAPDGTLYVADWNHHRIRRIASLLPAYDAEIIVITSQDATQQFIFNENGKHLETRHAWTGALIHQFEYNENGFLISITDGYNQTTQVERDGNNRPMAIVSPFGQRTELALDTNGYLMEIQPPAGSPHQFEYQGVGGLLLKVTDPRGNDTDTTYDARGRIIRHEDRENGFRTFERRGGQGSDFEIVITTALGATREHEVQTKPWGERLLIDRFSDSTEQTTRLTTNALIETTFPSGQVNTVQEVSDPRWGLQAPFAGTLSQELAPSKKLEVERVKEVALSDPEDLATLQRLEENIRINGKEYHWVYDADVQTVTLTSPMGRLLRYKIDEFGGFTEYQRGDLAPVRISLTGTGALSTLSQGTGNMERVFDYNYGADGFPNSLTDPLGRTTTFEIDALGRETSITLPNGLPLLFEYDDNDNLTRVTPPGKPAHVFTYTPRDDLEAYSPPIVNSEPAAFNIVYDLDGELIQEFLPDGRSILYDSQRGSCQCGNLEELTIDRGVFAFDYDSSTGQRSGVTTPENEMLMYQYEGENLREMEWLGTINGTVSIDYDNQFGVQFHRVNGLVNASFGYDDDGLMTNAGALQIEWRPDVPLISGTSLGVVTDTYTYNEFGEVTSYECRSNASTIFSASYTRDKMGRVLRLHESIQGEESLFEYDYDPAYRLTEVRKNSAAIFSCTYDTNENRLTLGDGVNEIAAVYDLQDRLETIGSRVFGHSPNGEIVSITNTLDVTTYDYDSLGNLLSVDLPNATQIDYLLDGQDRRIGKRVDGSLVQGFLYQDQLNPIAELDSTNGIVSQFVYATHLFVPDFLTQGLSTYRIIRDHIGSPRLVIDTATGNVLQRLDYDPMGQVTQDTNPGFQPFGFAGGLYDPHTGLVKLGSREYDPSTGRWTSKDPKLFGGGSNLYAYAENDPINLTDPFGAQPSGGGSSLPTPQEIEQMWNETFKKIDEFVERNKRLKRVKDRAKNLARRTKPSKAAQKAMQKGAQDAAKQSTKRCSPIFFLESVVEEYLRMLRCDSNPTLRGCFPRGA